MSIKYPCCIVVAVRGVKWVRWCAITWLIGVSSCSANANRTRVVGAEPRTAIEFSDYQANGAPRPSCRTVAGRFSVARNRLGVFRRATQAVKRKTLVSLGKSLGCTDSMHAREEGAQNRSRLCWQMRETRAMPLARQRDYRTINPSSRNHGRARERNVSYACAAACRRAR